jgi:hypothetical protein
MFILVITGASGVGKTSAVRAVDARAIPGVRCFYFDSIGVPAPEAMEREHGSAEGWQSWATRHWLGQLDRLDPTTCVAVLDGQTRPSFVAEAAGLVGRRVETMLLVCEHGERERRLRDGRGQPELATPEMSAWATYLRGQADALGLPVLDTTRLTTNAVADHLAGVIARLLEPATRDATAGSRVR